MGDRRKLLASIVNLVGDVLVVLTLISAAVFVLAGEWSQATFAIVVVLLWEQRQQR